MRRKKRITMAKKKAVIMSRSFHCFDGFFEDGRFRCPILVLLDLRRDDEGLIKHFAVS